MCLRFFRRLRAPPAAAAADPGIIGKLPIEGAIEGAVERPAEGAIDCDVGIPGRGIFCPTDPEAGKD